jgi:hypothetical protein
LPSQLPLPQSRFYADTRSALKSTEYLKLSRHIAGSLLHPQDAEACCLRRIIEPSSIIFNYKFNGTVLEAQRNGQDSWFGVDYGIRNGFLAYMQQRVRSTQIQRR